MTQEARCKPCEATPTGESGHRDLVYQLEGPYPGHGIFRCRTCGERWIRHYGSVEEKRAWTLYSEQFAIRKPLPDSVPLRVR
jgi:hypothetical protein